MSDFPGTIVGISPPCNPFFFVAKIFFEFSEKMSNFFFNEIDCKKLSKFFSMNSAVKNFRKVFTVNFIEKKNRNFFGKFEKNILPQNKRVYRGEIPTIFPGKSDTTFHWVLTFNFLLFILFLFFRTLQEMKFQVLY